MTLSEEQLDMIYQHTLQQLRLKVVAEFGTLESFAKQSGIPRTTLSKVFSDNISRDMSIGMYLRILKGLNMITKFDVAPEAFETKVTIKEYLAVDNNLITNSIALVTNDLWD